MHTGASEHVSGVPRRGRQLHEHEPHAQERIRRPWHDFAMILLVHVPMKALQWLRR